MDALYYDGKRAAPRRVTLSLAAGTLTLAGDAVQRQEALAQVMVSERLAHAPCTLQFVDGASCEVADGDALEQALRAAGHQRSGIEQLQRRWRPALAAMVLLGLLGILGYRLGIPVLATCVADRIPQSLVTELARRQLQLADEDLLAPSKLPVSRQDELAARFASMKRPGTAENTRLMFRSAPALGPNAFTLPDGSIVLLDELVTLSDNDEQVLAVLCHEAGHAAFRHGLRKLLQGAAVAAALFAWVGDANALLAGLSSAALTSAYSRDYERQADTYAGQMLKLNAIAPTRFAEMLRKLGQWQAQHGNDSPGLWSYLASHPATEERIAEAEASR